MREWARRLDNLNLTGMVGRSPYRPTIEYLEDKMALQLLLSDSRGTSIPYDFITGFDLDAWHVAHLENDIAAIADKSEEYWDSWQTILDTAWQDYRGERYTLYQDGDLWAGTEEDFEEFLEQ